MNLDIFTEAPIAIQSHIVLAAGAVIIGGLQLVLRRGTPRHRITGRVWVILMSAVALTSFFIHDIRIWGAWSPIHLLSVFTLIMLFLGIRAARLGKHRTHAITMSSTYFFALILTGALTLLPDRMMHEMLLG